MTTRPTESQTSSIDLRAAIMTATRRTSAIYRDSGQALVSFEFKDDESKAVIVPSATGELAHLVKRFAAYRAWLYCQAREVW